MKLSDFIMTACILWMLSCQPETIQPAEKELNPDQPVKYEVTRGALTRKTIKFISKPKGAAGAGQGTTCIVDGAIVDDCPLDVIIPGGSGTGGNGDNYANIFPDLNPLSGSLSVTPNPAEPGIIATFGVVIANPFENLRAGSMKKPVHRTPMGKCVGRSGAGLVM